MAMGDDNNDDDGDGATGNEVDDDGDDDENDDGLRQLRRQWSCIPIISATFLVLVSYPPPLVGIVGFCWLVLLFYLWLVFWLVLLCKPFFT